MAIMPTDTTEIAKQAWVAAHRAEAKAESGANRATEAYFELIGEVRALRAEGTARESRVQAWQEAISRQIKALTEAVRRVRKSTSDSSEEEIRNELPTLPEIIVEAVQVELRRDSDRAKAKQMRAIQGWLMKGVGKVVTTLVALALMTSLGWIAHQVFGASRAPVLTHSPTTK